MTKRVFCIHFLSLLISKAVPLVLCWLAFREFHQSAIALAQGGPGTNPYLEMLASVNNARSFVFLLGILGVLYGLQQQALRRRAATAFSSMLAAARRSPSESHPAAEPD